MKHWLKLIEILLAVYVSVAHSTVSNENTESHVMFRLPSYSSVRFEAPKHFKRRVKILFWNPLYGKYTNWGWWFAPGHMKESCPDINCEFTVNKQELDSSDAVVFMVYAESLILDSTHENFTAQFPPYRFPQHRWIYFTIEPPSLKRINQSSINHLFNWTMTYRRDSDVEAHYGKLVLKALPTEAQRVASRNRDYTKGKTKLAAWFVSHCPTEGNRELYVKELQKYMTVDIYGACGNLTCEPKQGPKCYDKLKREYKFYLSFENILCKDYVTEKFVKSLASGVVPVVFGGADYSKFAPTGSYISALDFQSPAALAQYLTFLDKDDAEYNKYFDWKRGYAPAVIKKHQFYSCDLCLKLMDPDIPPKVYHNMNFWWNRKSECRSWKMENTPQLDDFI